MPYRDYEFDHVSYDDSYWVKGTITKIMIPEDIRRRTLREWISGGVDAEITTGIGTDSERLKFFLKSDRIDFDIFGKTLLFNLYRGILPDIHYDVISIEPCENIYGIPFTEGDVEEIIQASNDSEFFNNLVNSIAPDVPGMEDIKSILALQLFGGRSRNNDGFLLGNIHLLLFADSDIGTDSLLESMSRLSPRGLFLSDNRGHTDICLNGKEIRDQNGRTTTIEAGAATIANGGLVCYENLDRYRYEENTLHYIVHDGRDTFSDGHYPLLYLPANTSLLCSIQPKSGKISDGAEVSEQIDLPPHVLGEFDLIIPIKNIPRKTVSDNTDHSSVVYGEEFIRKYVAYARLNCEPVFREQLIELAMGEYQSLKKSHDYIVRRQVELLIILAEASARARLSDTVEEIDLLRSSAIIDCCLNRLDSLTRES